MRPQGSSDPADNITIYMLEIDADGQGIAADGQLVPGVTYDIIVVDSSNPIVQYSNLFVCFATGTRIAKPDGLRRVEGLSPGDLISTLDHGTKPLRWIGRRTLQFGPGSHDQNPIVFPAGCLGGGVPRRDLVDSPQHRMLLRGQTVSRAFGTAEVLAPAKALLSLPDVRRMAGRRSVTYHSLLLDRHEVILAEGSGAESFYPGPYAMQLLGPRIRAKIFGLFPALLTDPERVGMARRPARSASAARRKSWLARCAAS